jgi:Uma2 family endonuclease
MITSLQQLDLTKTYTYADYLTWQFDDYVELLKGKIYRMAAPSRRHQMVTGNLYATIRHFLWKKPCHVFIAPFDVRLTIQDKNRNQEITTVVQPDVCVVCDASKLDDAGCVGAPDLIIETLSPGNTKKEMKNKYTIYEEAGVQEYWIVYPIDKTVQRFVLNEHGKYVGLAPLTDEDVLTTTILPNLEIRLEDIFED